MARRNLNAFLSSPLASRSQTGQISKKVLEVYYRLDGRLSKNETSKNRALRKGQCISNLLVKAAGMTLWSTSPLSILPLVSNNSHLPGAI
jgi:hypothetical protein